MMQQEYKIDLKEFVDYPHTDWISGREFGEDKAKRFELLKHLHADEKIVLVIDDNYVKAINDSFIKGFFKEVFDLLKSKKAVEKRFEVQGNPFFKRLFEKNFKILDSIYNHHVA